MLRVNVPRSMRDSFVLEGSELRVGEDRFDLRLFKRIFLVSIGKASVPMAEHAIQTLGDALPLTGVVVGLGTWAAPPGILSLRGDHPVPGRNSFVAAHELLQLMQTADEDTLVLYLISGGASAMAEAPLDASISSEDLSAFYRRLLHSGLAIGKTNVLRKHFSAIKGGRLALAAGAATRCTVLISDVPPGRLDIVGSGPSLADTSTVEEVRRILAETPLLAPVPEAMARFLEQMPETPKTLPEGRLPSTSLSLLSSDSLIEEAIQLVSTAGYRVIVDNTCDDWDYSDAAKYLVERAREESVASIPLCILSAGEVTVSIKGQAGLGGRNQQWALRVAQLIDGQSNFVAMSVGSDGIDGNSPAAGAVVDGSTWQRALRAGMNPQNALESFNAYPLFEALGDTVDPGPSGNNIRDLRVIFVNKQP
nr:DUF4147 domain-containing protein [Terriglobus saanensis]